MLGAACAVLGGALFDPTPHLAPVMAEADGVHPARAAQAFRNAYAPGVGFPDKYPPLGSFLHGAVVRVLDPEFTAQADALVALAEAPREQALWERRQDVERLLAGQRALSRAAQALAALFAALWAASLAERLLPGPASRGAALAGFVAGLSVALGYPFLYYGGTTNVDALALAAGLGALLAAERGRWVSAGVAAGLAVAIKDPYYVLAAPLLVAAWARAAQGRRRTLLALVTSGGACWALASGALTTPTTWWEHLRYLVSGGVAGVERIDAADPAQWWALMRLVGRHWVGTFGTLGTIAALCGLAVAARRLGASLLVALLAAPLLFVAPVGFAYVRFSLIPLAVLGVGLGLAVAWLAGAAAARAGAARRLGPLLLLGAIVASAAHDGALDYHRHVHGRPDARAQAAAWVAEHVPAGSSITLLADERRHGPPLDPFRLRVAAFGLDQAAAQLASWQAQPVAQRPDYVLWMSFPVESTAGRVRAPPAAPALGERPGGIYEVAAVWGAPSGARPESTLTLRPTIALLRRLGP